MEDTEIVELYLSRDESAIANTAQKYGFQLRQIARRILGDLSMAEECENDTYLEAWKLIPPHEPRNYLFTFLGKITRHLAIDECRKMSGSKKRGIFCELTQEMAECIPARSDIEGEIEAEALRRTIDSFLAECSEEQRDVFVRRYWFFDTVSEICKRYGFSQSKVKTMLHRVREKLRDNLEKEGYTV